MKIKEIKMLSDGKVEIVFESNFDELKEVTHYDIKDVINVLEWNMNEARKDLQLLIKTHNTTTKSCEDQNET